jgi:putative FmdB family regulatory protein
MPTYQYRCSDCSHEFEQYQRFTEDALTECPSCNGGIRRVIQPVGVVFKGSGWYITDSRKSENGSSGNGTAKSDKNETAVAAEKTETSGKPDRAEKSEKTEKPAKNDAKESSATSTIGAGATTSA